MTQFSSLEEISRLKSAFRASSLSTPLRDAVSVSIDDSSPKNNLKASAQALSRLQKQRFDQAPVRNHGKVVGWILTKELEKSGDVIASTVLLADSVFVSSDTSIGQVVRHLFDSPFVFTVTESGIDGFICVSDLDRHVVRAYFAVLISQVEMMLAHLVGEMSETSELEKLIVGEDTHEEGRSLRAQYLDSLERGQETSPVEYLYLNQLVTVLTTTVMPSGKKVPQRLIKDLFTVVENRNFIAHATRRQRAENAPTRLKKLDLAFERLLGELPRLLD